MFEAGTYIICGQHGVCRVEAIGPLELLEASRDRIYYTLSQVYTKGGTIYVPADSEKIIMRPVLSREEAEELIDQMEEIETIWVENEKRREDVFKEALKTCRSRDWVRIIKTLYVRRQARLAQGKKVTAGDEKYLRIAEENLYGELAVALGMKKDEMGKYLAEKIESRRRKA